MQRVTNINELNSAISLNGKLKRDKNEEVNLEDFADEEIREEIIRDLKIAEGEIERGECIKAEVVFEELRKKYGWDTIWG